MSKTAYEIETELGGSGPNRTGFGGRPELINFYMESMSDVSALPVLGKLEIDALRCGKMIPVITFTAPDPEIPIVISGIATVAVSKTEVIFKTGSSELKYTIATKTWAAGA